MLNAIITHTKLNEKAFLLKPVNRNHLACSNEFWKKKYQEQGASDYSNKLKHLFDILFNTIKLLTLTEHSFDEIINTLKELQKKCDTPLFANYSEGIKQQLEIMTYHFFVESPSKKKQSCLAITRY